jgi:hypothetical protein
MADSAVQEALECAYRLGTDAGSTRTITLASVDPRNEPSRRMLARHGFRYQETLGGYEDWAVVLAR